MPSPYSPDDLRALIDQQDERGNVQVHLGRLLATIKATRIEGRDAAMAAVQRHVGEAMTRLDGVERRPVEGWRAG